MAPPHAPIVRGQIFEVHSENALVSPLIQKPSRTSSRPSARSLKNPCSLVGVTAGQGCTGSTFGGFVSLHLEVTELKYVDSLAFERHVDGHSKHTAYGLQSLRVEVLHGRISDPSGGPQPVP